jgi:hypothetical protein
MRSNRRRRSSFRTVNTRVVAFVVIIGFIVAGGAIVNLSLRSSVSAINRDIKKLEGEQKAINDDIQREKTNWAAMITPAELESALTRHGLHMENPRGEQIVNLTPRKSGVAAPFSTTTGYASKR